MQFNIKNSTVCQFNHTSLVTVVTVISQFAIVVSSKFWWRFCTVTLVFLLSDGIGHD